MIWTIFLNLIGIVGCCAILLTLLLAVGVLCMSTLELLGLDYEVQEWWREKFKRWRHRKHDK